MRLYRCSTVFRASKRVANLNTAKDIALASRTIAEKAEMKAETHFE
jgi:hypothetical protein